MTTADNQRAVVHLTAEDLMNLAAWLDSARDARLMIDEGGIKVSAERSVWSFPPLGQIGYPELTT